MLLTIENQTAEDLEIGFPFNRTLGPNGDPDDALTLGVALRDLTHGEDVGDAAYKRLNLLRQEGKITMSIASDAQTQDILDEAVDL
jgi:hypothetical protein